jgi:hypothetical protein
MGGREPRGCPGSHQFAMRIVPIRGGGLGGAVHGVARRESHGPNPGSGKALVEAKLWDMFSSLFVQ